MPNRPKRKSVKVPKHKNTSNSYPFFDYLPQDIISAILIRLPITTLVLSRFVCKLWFYLISSPKFIKTHLEKSSFSKDNANHRLILNKTSSVNNFLKSCLLTFNKNNKSVVLLESLYCPKRDNLRSVTIVGSCNGLLCISMFDVGIFLWNPCTRISKKLPCPGMQPWRCIYGFGYDHANDDYKVLWTVLSCGVMGNRGKNELIMYSLKTDSWSKIGDFSLGTLSDKRASYVNGVFHWSIVQQGGGNFSMVIVSLDLGNETYGEIPQPCYGNSHVTLWRLGVLDGCLSIFCHTIKPYVKPCFDIWVMKEYGVSESWVKLYTIPYNRDIVDYFPLCISVTGEILLRYGLHLVLYNPINGRFRQLKMGNLSGTLKGLDAITYVESLVSPNIDNGVPSTQQ